MTLSELAAAWVETMLYVSVKGAVLLLLAGGLMLALRQASAATRHALWSMALIGLLLLPALALVVPAWNPGWLPRLSGVLPPPEAPTVIVLPSVPNVPDLPAEPEAPAAPASPADVLPAASVAGVETMAFEDGVVRLARVVGRSGR